MVLSELAAFEAAYQVLQPLDAAGRRRALRWLSDALDAESPLAAAPAGAAKPTTSEVSANGGSTRQPPASPVRRRAKSALAAPTTRSRRARPARQADAAPAEASSRPYRRMPPAAEVMKAYRQVGTIGGLAQHFDVPRHTVQGWARLLRRQGHAIGRTS
jgi:hypothetical protein